MPVIGPNKGDEDIFRGQITKTCNVYEFVAHYHVDEVDIFSIKFKVLTNHDFEPLIAASRSPALPAGLDAN